MRTAFFDALQSIADEDDRLHLVVGDIGFGLVERFAEAYPDRFLNVGVAEQSMIMTAAGLALEGATVVCYSIANFPTLRCFEQIRNDVVGHDLAVIVASAGTGLAYGSLGYSHHAVEDIAVMRSLAGLDLFIPGDPLEARVATTMAVERRRPAYLRMGRAGEPQVHSRSPVLRPGQPLVVANGTDVAIVVAGTMLPTACQVRDLLAADNVSASVVSCPWLPLQSTSLAEALAGVTLVVTLEEHRPTGGLGGHVAELTSAWDHRPRVLRLGLDEAVHTAGDREYLLRMAGLSSDAIRDRVLSTLA